MNRLNLTELALKHKPLVYYFIVVVFVMGTWSYTKLGRMEDPDFTIRQMVVSVAWPGATAQQVEEQVTDKIEKKLQDLPKLDYIKSYSRPGLSVITVYLREDVDPATVRPAWVEARNMVNDIRGDLPAGVVGPAFNDRFDDVFGAIYALTGDGFSYEELRREAERIRRILLNVDDVKKVNLVGVQEEKIYVEIEHSKLAQLGVSPAAIAGVIGSQNAMAPAGMVDTASDNVYLRLTGVFEDVEALKNLPVRANGRTFKLGDIATVDRRYKEPSDPKMFYNGVPAVGLALSMEQGGNILTLGEALNDILAQIQRELPAGMTINQVADQPKVVEAAIGDFVRTLWEAIVIVMLIGFLSLGLRTGSVVALCIPLVVAGVFFALYLVGIDLHKVSLGALIISLGLLVDDAMIAVEMMAVKLEEGYERFEAACYAYRVTAVPMLTGTLITCAGFIPVGFSKGMASEFAGALFPVILMALLISWVVSVTVAPVFGYSLIKLKLGTTKEAMYDTKFYRWFRSVLLWCLRHRVTVMTATIVLFVISLGLSKFVKQEFFPPSSRPEVIVDLTLPEGASVEAAERMGRRFAAFLDASEEVRDYSYYVGTGAPRFVLTLEPTLPMDNYAQFVIVAKDVAARQRLTDKIYEQLAAEFSDARGNLSLIQTGPPAPYPVMLRVSGYEMPQVRGIAAAVAERLAGMEHLKQINFDWNEKNKVMRLELDQPKLRNLGITSSDVANMLQTELSGADIAQLYERDRTIDIAFRLNSGARNDLSAIGSLPVYLPNGMFVPLEQVAKISYHSEEGLIWRRDLKPTITVRAGIDDGLTANDMTLAALTAVEDIKRKLPPGYTIEAGGSLENSVNSSRFMFEPVPMMIMVIMTILMIQIGRVKPMLLILLTVPFGIIGVVATMLVTDQPLGFVAQLGVLALGGMIIRNSIILIDQIELHRAAGQSAWQAIVDSAILRFRPIMLTASSTILGMVPLMSNPFWAPMAAAIGGGLFAATMLTLLVLPTMYAIAYRVRE